MKYWWEASMEWDKPHPSRWGGSQCHIGMSKEFRGSCYLIK